MDKLVFAYSDHTDLSSGDSVRHEGGSCVNPVILRICARLTGQQTLQERAGAPG